MSRRLRVEFPSALFHVTSRGDRREAIYLDDADRQQWLALFGKVWQRFNWICHAYCLMVNHFHIVEETVEGNLSAGMRQLNGVYTQWHNRAHGRIGYVFQGRFKAVIVQRESYLLELARYVVLNSVRAGLCAVPSCGPGAATAPRWAARRHPIGSKLPGYFRTLAASSRQPATHTSAMRAPILAWPALGSL